jgi:hypothetical protein
MFEEKLRACSQIVNDTPLSYHVSKVLLPTPPKRQTLLFLPTLCVNLASNHLIPRALVMP